MRTKCGKRKLRLEYPHLCNREQRQTEVMEASHSKPAHPSRYTAHYQTTDSNSVVLAKQNKHLAFILSVMVTIGFKLWFPLC